jgi:hypothetical protein
MVERHSFIYHQNVFMASPVVPGAFASETGEERASSLGHQYSFMKARQLTTQITFGVS